MITEFVITEGEKRKRLDQFLVHREPEVSRSSLQRLIELGRIRVNAQKAKPGQKVKPGDRITMDRPEPGPMVLNGQALSLQILYEDDDLIVINKPAGVVVHPTSGNWSGTLWNAFLAHLQTHQATRSPLAWPSGTGLVHRLDKETSGVMVMAKTRDAHRALAKQFEHHTITRTYEALVWGVPPKSNGVIDLAIGRDRNDPKRCSPDSDEAKPAVTDYEVLRAFGTTASFVQLHPHTGRTHQLRVHLASLGCPIMGDTIYGKAAYAKTVGIEIPRVMLHAARLGFQHPVTQAPLLFASNLPADMQAVREALQRVSRHTPVHV